MNLCTTSPPPCAWAAFEDLAESTSPHDIQPYETVRENQTLYACVFDLDESLNFPPQGSFTCLPFALRTCVS